MKDLQRCYTMEPPYINTFKNGMKFACYKVPYEGLFRVELFLRAGAIHQKKNNLGYAHFLEHLISFYPSRVYNDSLENQQKLSDLGINMNAWTDDDNCGYWLAGIDDHREFVLDLMINNLMEPEWGNKEVFKNEKQAVERELSGHLNDPWYNLDTALSRILYKETMLEYSTKAELESVKKMNEKNFSAFFETFYHPENMVLTITGNYDGDLLFETLRKTYSKYFDKKEGQKKLPMKLPEPKVDTKITKYYVKSDNEEYKLVYYIPLPDILFFDDKRYILEYVPFILTGTLSSRLYKVLRSKEGAVYNVHAELDLDPRDSTYSYFTIDTQTDEKHLKQVYEKINDIIFNFKDVSESEMTMCKLKTDGQYFNISQSKKFSDAYDFYNKYVVWEQEIKDNNLDTEYQKSKEITKKQVTDISKELFKRPIYIFYSGKENKLGFKEYKLIKDDIVDKEIHEKATYGNHLRTRSGTRSGTH